MREVPDLVAQHVITFFVDYRKATGLRAVELAPAAVLGRPTPPRPRGKSEWGVSDIGERRRSRGGRDHPPPSPNCLVPGRRYFSRMWTYRLADFDPSAGVAEEEWARRLAAEGWQMWSPGPGPWIELNGRRVRRWNVRREGGGYFRSPFKWVRRG